MPIMQWCGSFLLNLIVPVLFWVQAPSVTPATPAALVDPPRQEMQTVAPNVPVGPYLMFITGKTFVNDMFLDVALSANGKPVPDGTTVTFDAAPPTSGKINPSGGAVVLPSGTPIHLTAATTAGHARFAPPMDIEGDWGFTMLVEGAAGSGTTATPLKIGVDPHSPPASLSYRLSQIAIPVVSVLLLLVFFRLRHIELERRPADQPQTQTNPAS